MGRGRRQDKLRQRCPCGNFVRAAGQYSCKYCHAAYMRAWRQKAAKELAELRAIRAAIRQDQQVERLVARMVRALKATTEKAKALRERGL